ncbi:hypothetical protein D3C77_421100 [compost metagenome]
MLPFFERNVAHNAVLHRWLQIKRQYSSGLPRSNRAQHAMVAHKFRLGNHRIAADRVWQDKGLIRAIARTVHRLLIPGLLVDSALIANPDCNIVSLTANRIIFLLVDQIQINALQVFAAVEHIP